MPVLDLVPQPDGRVAIIHTYDGTLFVYARDQAEAEEVAVQYEQILRELAPIAWEIGRGIWRDLTPERRAHYTRLAQEEEAAKVAA